MSNIDQVRFRVQHDTGGEWRTSHGADLATLDKACQRVKAGPGTQHRILMITGPDDAAVVAWQGKRVPKFLGAAVTL